MLYLFGNYFYSPAGLRFFENKLFRAKTIFLTLFNKNLARTKIEVDPARIRQKTRTVKNNAIRMVKCLKLFFHGLREKHLRRHIIVSAERTKGVFQGLYSEFFSILESRLDGIAFRSGVFPSNRYSYQVIKHGGVMVNGFSYNLSFLFGFLW